MPIILRSKNRALSNPIIYPTNLIALCLTIKHSMIIFLLLYFYLPPIHVQVIQV